MKGHSTIARSDLEGKGDSNRFLSRKTNSPIRYRKWPKDGKTALVIGRFQPLHNGHLAAIKAILSKHAKLILVIGSSQESGTDRNPFTVEERKEMIKAAMKKEHLLNRITILELPDQNDHALWVRKVLQIASTADVTYSGNWLVQKLLKPKYEVHTMRSSVKISATIIRALIKGHREWKKWVPKEISKYIVKHNLEGIIRKG